jgi:hypothetical protein
VGDGERRRKEKRKKGLRKKMRNKALKGKRRRIMLKSDFSSYIDILISICLSNCS